MAKTNYNSSTHWFISFYLSTIPTKDQQNLQIVCTISASVCVFGVLGNILCAIVLHRMTKTNHRVRLLIYLSVVDIVILLCLFLSVFVIGLQVRFFNVLYIIFDPFAYLCGLTVYTFEIYLTVLVAIERCTATAMPLRFVTLARSSLTNKTLLVIGVFSVVLNVPNWFAYQPCLYWNDEFNMTFFTGNTTYQNSHGYSIYRRYVTLVFRCILPIVILIVCNVILVISRTKLTVVGQAVRGNSDQFAAAVVAITVGSVITHVTSAANLIIEDRLPKIIDAYVSLTDATVIALNSSTNFIFYCFFGREFRKTIVSMFKLNKQEETIS